MTQREGRILRQGNMNSKVQIFRYITEGSFDAYSWQLLETKQRFITKLLSGSLAERSESDVDGTVLDYAEVKALAIGNPLVKERVETANELSRYLALQHKLIESRIRIEKELLEIPAKKSYQENNIARCKVDIIHYSQWKQLNPIRTDSKSKKSRAENRRQIRECINSSVVKYILEPKEKKLMTYCGFDLILPANVTRDKFYIWIERNSRYYVELGNIQAGTLKIIDNFLENLPVQLDKLEKGLVKLQERERQLKEVFEKKESFSDEIENCRKRLEILDIQLGVNKNE